MAPRPRSPAQSPVFNSNQSLQDMRVIGTQQSDERSAEGSACEEVTSVATPSSVFTPSSVVVGSPTTLNRQLSDLSGSYNNGSPMPHRNTPSRAGVPRNIFSPITMKQPWRQAYSLSSPAPDMNEDGPPMPFLNPSPEEMIMVELNGGVEVVPPELVELKARLNFALPKGLDSDRFPIVIVLMHPGNKTYELLRLWLDLANDTVRGVLQTIRQNIPNSWNQDYDGLVQPRGARLSQLINCMRIKQFAAVPYEVWIAKPWALAADHTARYADNLLDHLKAVGVVQSNNSPRLVPQAGEGAVTLSADAQKRIYAPGGTLTHHHAMQYLSFCPPFENEKPAPSPTPDKVDLNPRSDAQSQKSMDLYIAETGPPPRAMSPELFSLKSPTLTSTAISTQGSQDWDEGTVKMTANLRNGLRTFPSFQSLESLKGLRGRRGPRNYGRRRLQTLGACFSGLKCARRTEMDEQDDETRPRLGSQDLSSFTMALDDHLRALIENDDHLRTLYEVDSEDDMEDERSFSDMPLLNSNRRTSR